METTKGQELLQTLITKSWEDESFKEKLIADPKEEIEKITGKSLSGDKKIFAVDQSNPDHVYINIPAKPDLEDVELTENQLEAVAGGSDPWYYYLDPTYTGEKLAIWLIDQMVD